MNEDDTEGLEKTPPDAPDNLRIPEFTPEGQRFFEEVMERRTKLHDALLPPLSSPHRQWLEFSVCLRDVLEECRYSSEIQEEAANCALDNKEPTTEAAKPLYDFFRTSMAKGVPLNWITSGITTSKPPPIAIETLEICRAMQRSRRSFPQWYIDLHRNAKWFQKLHTPT